MNTKLEFNAVIQKVPDINGAYVEAPFDVKKEFNKSRALVKATFDGQEYDGQLVKMGTPCHIIGITKAIRDKIGKQVGDTVHVTIQERQPKAPEYTTVDQYIQRFSGDVRQRLENLREIIIKSNNNITQKISWDMPTFVYGKFMVHFAVGKNHIGFYPAPSAIVKFKSDFDTLGLKYSKGAVQFSNSKPMPYELIRQIVLFRLQDNGEN